MTDNVKYTANYSDQATPPKDTEIRTTASTEVGNVGKQIQHVKIDVGDGTNTQPVSNAVLTNAVDGATTSLKIIDYAHHEVHGGSSFSLADTVACDTTTCQWQVTTPDSLKYTHLIFELSCTGEATYLVTEGSDRVDGTALAEVNRRRVGTPAVAGTIVTRTPTGGSTDGAITLFSMRNGITNVAGKNVEAGSARAQNEWILKPNTKYVVSVTTYAAVYVTCLLNWYEHTDA